MDERDRETALFEAERRHLHAVAHRMLGSVSEAEDAVQETWLRFARTELSEIDNPPAWLTTVLSRICLDLLRARATRREEPLSGGFDAVSGEDDPESEAVLIDSVGRALLVVLDTLGPDERVAFVLHDLFAVPFEAIAPIVGRTPATTKKLASRARLRVRGGEVTAGDEIARQRPVVAAFLAAAREGDIEGLLAVLAPDVVRVVEPGVLPGLAAVVRGARAVAEETVVLRGRARSAVLAMVDGAVGIVVAPGGRLGSVLRIAVEGDRVAGYEVIADPVRLRGMRISVLSD